MALDFNNARLALWLTANGVPLGDVVTIGRLGVFLSPELLEADAAKFGITSACGSWSAAAQSKFCEPVLKAMGASSVKALDFSAYEGATVLHDLNKTLPPDLENICDVLFDTGSLEHVFNVPAALDSYARLVRPGGWMLLDLPANGCCGHGFYQFSPELFYQYFEGRGDCRVAAMFCVRDEPLGEWFLVPSPASIGQRVYLHDQKPVHIFVVVQRLDVLSRVAVNPVQADYDQAWQAACLEPPELGKMSDTGFGNGIKERIRHLLRRIVPIAYWRRSVARNAERQRKQFKLEVSPKLKKVDCFTWRMTSPGRNPA